MPTKTKKNPPDLTLRNLRAQERRLAVLRNQIADLFEITATLSKNQELMYKVLQQLQIREVRR